MIPATDWRAAGIPGSAMKAGGGGGARSTLEMLTDGASCSAAATEGGDQAGGPGSVRLALPGGGGLGSAAAPTATPGSGEDAVWAAEGRPPTSNSRPCGMKIGTSTSSAANPCAGIGLRALANGEARPAGWQTCSCCSSAASARASNGFPFAALLAAGTGAGDAGGPTGSNVEAGAGVLDWAGSEVAGSVAGVATAAGLAGAVASTAGTAAAGTDGVASAARSGRLGWAS